MEQFNSKKLFLIKYTMIKKPLTNIQLYSNSNSYPFLNIYDFSSINSSFFKNSISLGKKKFGRSGIRRVLWNKYFVSRHENQDFYRYRVSKFKFLKLKNFYFFLKKIDRSMNFKNIFFSKIFYKTSTLFHLIPRKLFLFLLNNQDDFFNQKKISLDTTPYALNSSLVLKKKSKPKKTGSNYLSIYKTINLTYNFVEMTLSYQKQTNYYLYNNFFYSSLLSIYISSLSNKFI